jgi:hypothetical protein
MIRLAREYETGKASPGPTGPGGLGMQEALRTWGPKHTVRRRPPKACSQGQEVVDSPTPESRADRETQDSDGGQ